MQAQAIHLQTMLNQKLFEVPGAKKTLDSCSDGNNIYSKSQLSISLYSKITLQMKKYDFE
jgi:hypothetical protein